MKLKVIVPVITEELLHPTRKEVKKFVSKDTEIDAEVLKYGTASIESAYDGMLCAPDTLRIVEEAEKEGFDGVYIDCMGDPALEGARETVDIPVVGPGQTCMHIASDLSHRFSVVTVLENIVPLIENISLKAGLERKLASVRAVDIPVLKLHDEEKLTKALAKESKKAIEQDDAHSIVLGCTGMRGVAETLQDELDKENYGIPVIYPVAVAMRYLEMLVKLDLSQSKRTYMHPPEKERNIGEILE